jgi:hypothetical protein
MLFGFAAVLGVAFAIRQPVGVLMFFGFVIAAAAGIVSLIAAVLTYGYFALRYRFGERALTVHWLWSDIVIPLAEVDGVYLGTRIGQAMRVRGLSIPGYHVGSGRTRTLGLIRYVVTTSDLSNMSLITTSTYCVAVSPADPDAFRRELIRRLQASEALEPEPGEAAVSARPGWRDPWLVAAAGVSVFLLCLTLAYTWFRWESLPEMIAMRTAVDGTPEQMGPREDVFRLPAIGLAILIANIGVGLALYAREHAGARMLWVAAGVVQMIVLIGTARILH